MNPLIDGILSRHARDGHRVDSVIPMLDLAEQDPAALETLLMQSMRCDCTPATFLDRALGLLTDDRLIAVADAAWRTLLGDPAHRQARQIVGYALYQACDVLIDDWEALLAVAGQQGCAATYPWRGLPADVAARWAVALEAAEGRDDVDRALALVKSGRVTVQDRALAYLVRATGQAADAWAHEAGLDRKTAAPLHTDQPLHLRFAPAQRAAQNADAGPWRRRLWRLHATWSQGESRGHAHMGGHLQARCGVCHAPLQRLLSLDARHVGATAEGVLTLGLCLDCCGWSGIGPLFYRHAAEGLPQAHPSQCRDVPAADVEGCGVLMEADVELVSLPGQRWREQDWGVSNHDENLSRVGGAPSWVQSAQYPSCPDCGAAMPVVMQLDSVLPTVDGGILLWGSGGMLYTYWCDGCAVSAHLWQCT
ncbi:MAG: hypothetical protein ACN6RH_04150 [Stenotrophomonas rhizophila]|uniref:hypothetical protein n=1 Tax=Stenotrophomonas rhizophila TaxID=216778 RepID=UPI0010C0029D|nr:hypothetical protein [Stenotrophomonas rhizophila]